ncbi:hypothetical protein L218DRAFT_950542 [Marasmius fiardii PR-910]|nr:hypothetical protein L218DRAFT_950542 [Marasmius fiardii PR-910]
MTDIPDPAWAEAVHLAQRPTINCGDYNDKNITNTKERLGFIFTTSLNGSPCWNPSKYSKLYGPSGSIQLYLKSSAPLHCSAGSHFLCFPGTYYLAFPKDHMWVKALVYILFLLATTHKVISINDSFKMFGSGFGDMGALKATALSGSLIVQSFYLYQVRVISRSWVIPALIPFVAMAQFIAAIISGVNFIFLGTLQAKPLAMIWNFGSALCDTIIAIAMTLYVCHTFSTTNDSPWEAVHWNLQLLRAGDGLTNQNPIIIRLVHLVVETGSLTGHPFHFSSEISLFLPSCHVSGEASL